MHEAVNIAKVMGSKSPERILMKLRIYNHVLGMSTHANPWREHVKKRLLWFLHTREFNVFLNFFGIILRLAPSPHE